MALPQVMCVFPILEHLQKASIPNKQENDTSKQKTQIPLPTRELTDMTSVGGNAAVNIFKNSYETDSTWYENVFVERNVKGNLTEDVSGSSLEERLREFQEKWICKVYIGEEVSFALIPCRYLEAYQEINHFSKKVPHLQANQRYSLYISLVNEK